MTEQTREQKEAGLEHDIARAKEQIQFMESMKALEKNKHFQRVVVEGFCRDEAARFVGMSVQLGQTAEDRAHALASAQAAGYFKQWMAVRLQLAEQAIRTLEDSENLLDALRAAPEAEAE